MHKENGILITDKDVVDRITRFLQQENAFERKLMCEYGYDGTQDKENVNGQIVFWVEEATSWDYYEELAGKYYSEEYIENVFTPFFLGNVYMEEDGKLFRTFADGIVNPLLESTIKVWKSQNEKYYVSITIDSVGVKYLQGYVLDLSEDSRYGFEILDKVILLDDNGID